MQLVLDIHNQGLLAYTKFGREVSHRTRVSKTKQDSLRKILIGFYKFWPKVVVLKSYILKSSGPRASSRNKFIKIIFFPRNILQT